MTMSRTFSYIPEGTPMNTIEGLKQTRAILVRDGWCQKTLKDDEGKRCLIGAIPIGCFSPALHALENVTETHGVPRWNDKPGRTKDEVLAAIDKAIRIEEAKL
jgi:hypothetical protein